MKAETAGLTKGEEEVARGMTAPPELKPYVLPTFSGIEPAINTNIEPYVHAPIINADIIFQKVLSCYPHKSKWKIDVQLRGAIRTSDVLNSTGAEIGRNYAEIVATMPLYSSKEMDRAIKNEHDLRQETAKTVSSFIKSIAERNTAVRKVALYTSLERRSSIRVQSGVVSATEQVSYLEKVANSHEALITAEADIMTSRIALSAMCSGQNYKLMNSYLISMSNKPTKKITVNR